MSAPSPPAVPGTATTVRTSPHTTKVRVSHPLDPLTPDEILLVTSTLRRHVATQTDIKAIKFIVCSLLPPPKRVVLAALGIPITPGAKPEEPIEIVRKAEMDFIDLVSGVSFNAIVVLKGTEWTVGSIDKLDVGLQPQISVEELTECEQIVRDDKRVQELALAVGVQPHQIYADGWAIGYDDRFPESKRIQQALCFARFSEHDNLYAHPLDFVPVIDSNKHCVIHIDFPPSYSKSNDESAHTLSTSTTAPPALDADPSTASNRDRIPPPRQAFDFLPDLMKETEEGYAPRTSLKPLHIVQPEGVSFKMDGHELEWENWKMHVAFSHREGIALSTVTYDDHGEVRPIFYRLSLAEMVVPYGAPEYPHPRKFAFDVGEYGMGTMANELSLGCDCLGQIHYLPGSYTAHDGSAVVIKNVICIHEEDAGVLWKHTDYRPGGRSQTVRSRRLVVSMVCTLANYEYIWNYYFYQDGNIELEVRLTGILQTYVQGDNDPNPYGTTIAPNVTAHYHQHLFSVRVDPMIDGAKNTIIEQDVVPSPNAPTGGAANFAGNAFIAQDTVLKSQKDGARSYDWAKDRKWKITNSGRQHYATGKDVGYSINMKGGMVGMMAREDGWAAKRAAFATKALWVVKDVEGPKGGRMWPSGKYVPQTREEPEDSVGKWTKEEGNIQDEDLVLFLTVGVTHIPRPEDWPVMPVEHLSILFKPNNFFRTNPAMDVPGSNDKQSVAAFNKKNEAKGDSCVAC